MPQLSSTEESAKGFGHQRDGWIDRGKRTWENQDNWVKHLHPF